MYALILNLDKLVSIDMYNILKIIFEDLIGIEFAF